MKNKLIKRRIYSTFFLLLLTFTSYAQRPFFDKSKDLLIAQFDSKPDPDDIHAQAALGSMLLHNDLKGVNYYAVAGAIGRQGGQFIDSDELFDLSFGKSNWTDADENWTASVTKIKNKVIPILNNGGKIWVQEAGQSDITADWVAQVINTVGASKVKNNVIVVQHSKWNQDQTTPDDLNYVKSKTNYFYIDDGNADFTEQWGDHGPYDTPRYRSRDSKWIALAKNSPNKKAKAIWAEADRVVKRRYPQGVPYDWSWMKNDGLDYSDCVENWWILNISDKANNVSKFWDRYVTNTTGSNPNSGSCKGKVFEETNGIVAIEAEDFVKQTATNDREWFVIGNRESTPTPDPDGSHASSASKGKYIELLPDTRVTHGDPIKVGVNFSDTPGKAVIDYKVKFNSPGKYFVWIRAYSSGTEDNGVHVGIDGTWPLSGRKMQWCTGKNQWTWESKQRTNANHCGEPEKIFINVPTAGIHTVSFSMREDGFEIDKFILSKTYTKPTGNSLNSIAINCDGDNDTDNSECNISSTIKGLKVSSKTKTSITVAFNEIPGANTYELRAWPKGEFTGSINTPKAVSFAGGSSSPLTIVGLNSGKEYTLVLRGICGVGKSTEFSQIDVTTVANAPKCDINTIITGLNASSKTKTSITVAFNEIAGAQNYELRAWPKGEFTGSINTPKAVSFAGGNSSPLNIVGLSSGKEYTLVLRGICGVGKSTKFSQIDVTTVANAPKCDINTIITGLNVSSKTKTSITVAFNEIAGVQNYELRAWPKGEFTGSINTPKAVSFARGSSSSLTIVGLNSGKEYTLVLRGICGVGKSTEFSQINAATKEDELTNGIYYIQNPKGTIRINSPSGSIVNQATTANNSAKWEITKISDYYTIKNLRNNEYLEVPFKACITGENTQNLNLKLATYSQVIGDHQRWKITKISGDYFISPLHCDKVIDRPKNNSLLLLWPLNTNNTNQNWKITRASATSKTALNNKLDSKNEIINIFPNPVVHNTFSIHLVNDTVSDISVFDIQGKLIYQNKFSKKTININRNNLGEKGLYFIKIKQGEITITKKIVLQ